MLPYRFMATFVVAPIFSATHYLGRCPKLWCHRPSVCFL